MLNRARMAAYLDFDRDAERCREIAAKCERYDLAHRRVGLIERGVEIHQARAELHREAFGEPEPLFVPFALLLADPTFQVDYRDHDAELARIEARKVGH